MPGTMIDLYKAPKTTHNIHVFRYRNSALLAHGVATGYFFFCEPDINRSLAFAQVPWLLQALRSYFIDRAYETVGSAPSDDWSLFFINPAFFYALWNNIPYAAHAFATISMASGLSMALTPAPHAKRHKGTVELPKKMYPTPSLRDLPRPSGYRRG